MMAAESSKLLKDTSFEEIVAKAKAGDGEAQLYLAKGHSLLIGGVPYNKQESHRWYLAAATNGLVEAELYLGSHYYQEALANRGVAAKDKAARNQIATASLSWNFKAAKQGAFEAWRRLGTAFDEGKVYAKDPVEAYKWYHLAIEKGDNKIFAPTQQRNALSLKLTPGQIELAKRRAQDFWDSLGEEKKPTAPK
ncbi:MAG: hypothetical protein B9S33_08345 [Pedosphaera sp. Tous-C6FEB]|nr:MAG: hypothetical protein B9S33_08345 [Pedosphaera sp. Tous-C6FEB]